MSEVLKTGKGHWALKCKTCGELSVFSLVEVNKWGGVDPFCRTYKTCGYCTAYGPIHFVKPSLFSRLLTLLIRPKGETK